jgi:diguanylate cyclase (GGDEF)-like protein
MYPAVTAVKPTIDQAKHETTLRAVQDFLIGGITLAAILLLVGTGTTWLRSITGITHVIAQSQWATTCTLLLNIALILFGWRRFRDLHEEVERRALAEAEALHLAHYDPLTGLLNRRGLAAMAKDRMAQWRSEARIPAALLIDIDSFKCINDLYGHGGGDRLLVATAERLSALDPADALIARLGGDEFAMLIAIAPNDLDALDSLAEAMTERLSRPVQFDGVSASTSASIGCALADNVDTALDTLLRQGDVAMYRAKQLGRCRWCRFDEAMGATLDRTDSIERALRAAIAAEEPYPVYEPLIDLSTGEPIGYEMLARWESEELGPVGPAEFIPVAESSGLIGPLADLLFRRALSEAKTWPTHLSLSINVSPLQLRDPWFAQKLLKLLAQTGFPGQRLIVELTESAIVDNVPLAKAVFESLRNQGIRMALDDFGTGYSSIASLRALPFDSVKIDREFVARMGDSANGQSIAEAVLQLGRSLGLPVVAEGIETGATANRLNDLDCDIGQGYFYGHSLTSKDVLAIHRGGGVRKAG